MPQGLGFLAGFRDKVELDLDFEFTPAGLDDFEGRLFDGAHVLSVGLVQLELDFLQPVGDIFAVDAFDEYAPMVRVVRGNIGWFLLWVEELGFAAEDWDR